MDKELKIFALEYVKLHDRLLKEQKLAIGQFIMEASDDQVKYMLVSGEVKYGLTEDDKILAKSFVETPANFFNTYDYGLAVGKDKGIQIAQAQGAKALTALAIVAAASTLAYAAYKRFYSKAAKACKGKGGLEKTNCMNKYKKQAQAAKIKELQSGMSKCAKGKDPSTCKLKLQGKINKEKAKMGAL
ncbi:MAG: hypothetical protein KGD64_04005 [Candidatus Heimdallarchaeota archaeon]|nr:hypothetical protein [Candidatus Heimdallarchaeota archaeon]